MNVSGSRAKEIAIQIVSDYYDQLTETSAPQSGNEVEANQ